MKKTTYSVLKVQDWLQFSELDEDGFLYHMRTFSENKIRISMHAMKKIAEAYHINDGNFLAKTYNKYFTNL